MSILVFNAGSSSLKFALFDDSGGDQLAKGMVRWNKKGDPASFRFRSVRGGEQRREVRIGDEGEAVEVVLRSVRESDLDDPIGGIGHRVVHGGTEFAQATFLDEHAMAALRRLATLAPLHNPPALRGIEAAGAALPDAKQVAVFDTSFFTGLPRRAVVYPVPYHWYEEYGIRRFGFHGISHQDAAARAAEFFESARQDSLRLVTCHLGSGCSVSAIRGRRPVATTMGFTPLEGLMMGTRSGSIDPGILIRLMAEQGFDPSRLEEALNRQSGLAGVSGVSADVRQVQRAAAAGNQRAQLAVEMFVDRARSAVGAFAVTLGGIDGLVFTGGIGENSDLIRGQICDGLQCLGLQLDQQRNRQVGGDGEITGDPSSGRVFRLRAQEEKVIAKEVSRLSGRM